MIYLFSQQYGSTYEHNFYDVITNTHHAVYDECRLYILFPGNNSYNLVSYDYFNADVYKVDSDNIDNIDIVPSFFDFEERMKFISNIIEQKIFENI